MSILPSSSETASYWVHDLDPFAIQFPEGFSIFNIPMEGIRWYGIAYALGFICAAVLLRLYSRYQIFQLGKEDQTDLLTYLIVGTLAGGRLGYMLFYNFQEWVQHPLSVIHVWDGGMASHGGMLGIAVALWLFASSRKIAFWRLTDIVVTLGPLGLFFGRVANFINGELWGKVTVVPWAVIFQYSNGVFTDPRHPSQLYQAGLEGLLLTVYLQLRLWLSAAGKRVPGQLTGEFLMVYGIARVIGECFREPDAHVSLLLGMSRGAFFSVLMFVAGVGLFLYVKRSNTTAC